MSENIKPILFSTHMVEAILDERKFQTRRVFKSKKVFKYNISSDTLNKGNYRFDGCDSQGNFFFEKLDGKGEFANKYDCIGRAPVSIGDILWVRETWQHSSYTLNGFTYKANAHPEKKGKWKPSIFMPKEAARIFLKITNVRIERLQDISVDDAIAEGINPLLMSGLQLATQGQLYQNYLDKNQMFNDGLSAYWSFNSLWCSINGGESWESNPFVFVYEFKIIDNPKAFKS